MYNFSFLDLFEESKEIISKITSLSTEKLKKFLLNFSDTIDENGIDVAIKNVSKLI